MVTRKPFRGCIQRGKEESPEFQQACRMAEAAAEELVKEGALLTASLYRHGNMCFLYEEVLAGEVKPENYLKALEPFLESWPEEDGNTVWAPMYAIYWHSVPGDSGSWEKNRAGKKHRVGRIAFLYPEKLFSYTYWHHAIVEEGLLLGDQYQFISLHENILFSYFEEPRQMVNIKNRQEPSRTIDGWMAADPESHFDRKKAGGDNFLIIESLLSVGKGDHLC